MSVRPSEGSLGSRAGLLRRAYRRFGSRYPRIAVVTVLQVVMMGGMVVGAGWAIVRRRRQRD